MAMEDKEIVEHATAIGEVFLADIEKTAGVQAGAQAEAFRRIVVLSGNILVNLNQIARALEIMADTPYK
jgi:hypothetical protein